ncbi:MAG: hypothetical protein ACPIA7_05455 [Akkermansiaceae bacterium]
MKKLTQKELAQIYKLDQSTITRLKKAGVDIHNKDAVRDAILNQPNRPKAWISGCPWDDAPEPSEAFQEFIEGDTKANIEALEKLAMQATDYNESRFIRTKIQSLRELLQLQILNGDYERNDKVFTDYTIIGNALKAGITAMQSDMPGMLEGLSAAQMKIKIKERGHQLMAELASLSEVK